MHSRLTTFNLFFQINMLLFLFFKLDKHYCIIYVLYFAINYYKIWKYQLWCSVLMKRLIPLTEDWDENGKFTGHPQSCQWQGISNFSHILFCADAFIHSTHSHKQMLLSPVYTSPDPNSWPAHLWVML